MRVPRRHGLHRFLQFVLAVLLLGDHGAAGLREVLPATSGDMFFVLFLYDVGLAPGAVLSLNITNVFRTNGTVVVILTAGQWASWGRRLRPTPAGSCSSYLVSYWRHPLVDRLQVRHHIRAAEPDRYYVGVLNAQLGQLVLEGDVAYVNPTGQHLPLQWEHLPTTLGVASVAFFVLLLVAIVVTGASSWMRIYNPLQGVLTACLLSKTAELMLEWKYFEILALDGSVPMWRFQAWQLASRIHAILEMLLLLLTAVGWQLLRRRLSPAEVRFTVVTISFTTFLAVLEVCSNLGADETVMIIDLFGVVGVICHLLIFFAINFNLQLISLHLSDSPATPGVASIYQKQQVYLHIRRICVALVFRSTVVNWLRVTVLNTHGTEWAADALSKAAAWCIYAGFLDALKPCPRRIRVADILRPPQPVSPLAGVEESPVAPRRSLSQAIRHPSTASLDVRGILPALRLGPEADALTDGFEVDGTLAVPYVRLDSGD